MSSSEGGGVGDGVSAAADEGAGVSPEVAVVGDDVGDCVVIDALSVSARCVSPRDNIEQEMKFEK